MCRPAPAAAAGRPRFNPPSVGEGSVDTSKDPDFSDGERSSEMSAGAPPRRGKAGAGKAASASAASAPPPTKAERPHAVVGGALGRAAASAAVDVEDDEDHADYQPACEAVSHPLKHQAHQLTFNLPL